MIKYDVNKKPYEHVSEFTVREGNMKLVPYIRVKDWNTGEVHVMRKTEFLLNGLPQEEKAEEVAIATEAEAPVDEVDETPETPVEDEVIEPETDEQVEVVEYVAVHTRTKEEVAISGQDELDAFIANHELEAEAVEAMLEGKQNTHKKWRVTKK